VVEDSRVQRAHLVRLLQADGDIEVIGEATDAVEAVNMTAALRPDVVTIDLQIPGGGGQHAIEQIMGHTPTPILVLSAHVATPANAPAVEALVGGALDAMPKPIPWTPEDEADVRRRVRMLSGVTVLRHPRGRLPPRTTAGAPPSTAGGGSWLIAVAASTGGPPALAQLLSGLAGVRAPVLVVQHIHAEFVDGLAAWMRRVAPLDVRVATHGEQAKPGVVYIGPADTHLRVASGLRLVLDPNPPTTHRPSADELFLSAAEHAGRSAIGVVLTGMGDDGAKGLLAIRNRGGLTIAQDEATSAVFGMPRAAQMAGAAVRVLPLDSIADALVAATQGKRA
jgi:two-component system chemotaxis response regulator CheB